MLNCVKEFRVLYNRISEIHIMKAVATLKIFVLLALLSFIQQGLTAPNKPNLLEHAYLDKLNKPWFKPDIPSEFPRKGEGLCKGKRCKVDCDDCQVHVPLDGPGSTKPATIPRSQLKYLNFVVQGATNRQKYTYWTAKNIAKDPRIDFRRMTLVVAIGYLDSTNFPISMILTNEYIRRGYNVILIDNQRFATVHYFLATRLMRPVGKHVAEILAILTRSGLDPTKLELLGFSLGGQTVSYIAKNFQLLTGRNISRITALEPAGPCFRNLGPTERLGSTNADFVQVIHTNIDGYGMANRMGHVDFYVNGGEYQPADLNLFPCTATCSHFRVLALWAIAVRNPEKFIAIKCNTIQEARDAECYKNKLVTNVMGLDVDVKKHGIFFLSTSKSYPFYLGKAGIKKEFAAWRRISDINDSNETDIYT